MSNLPVADQAEQALEDQRVGSALNNRNLYFGHGRWGLAQPSKPHGLEADIQVPVHHYIACMQITKGSAFHKMSKLYKFL